MFILYMETLNKVELMVGSSSKLSKKFIIGLEKLGLTLKEVQKYFIYAGGNKNRHLLYLINS